MAVIEIKLLKDCDGDDFDKDTVLDYAYRHDCMAFFELLHDRAGEDASLDEIIEDYASENKEEIWEFIRGD